MTTNFNQWEIWEVQLHVDVRMRQQAGINSDHEIKIRKILCRGQSAKIYTLEIYPLYGNWPTYIYAILLSFAKIAKINTRENMSP